MTQVEKTAQELQKLTAAAWRKHFAQLVRSVLGDTNSTFKIFNTGTLI